MYRSATLVFVTAFSFIALIVSIDASRAQDSFTPRKRDARVVDPLSACLLGCSRIPLQSCPVPPLPCDQPRFECAQSCRDGFDTDQDDGI